MPNTAAPMIMIPGLELWAPHSHAPMERCSTTVISWRAMARLFSVAARSMVATSSRIRVSPTWSFRWTRFW